MKHRILLCLTGAALLTVTSCSRWNNVKEEPLREKFFVASEVTTTETVVTTMTSVIPYFCFTTNAQACQGRRMRRRVPQVISLKDSAYLPLHLQASRGSSDGPTDLERDGQVQRNFFTVYKTQTDTLTIVKTSTNRAFTVSASAYCTYTGFTGPVCG